MWSKHIALFGIQCAQPHFIVKITGKADNGAPNTLQSGRITLSKLIPWTWRLVFINLGSSIDKVYGRITLSKLIPWTWRLVFINLGSSIDKVHACVILSPLVIATGLWLSCTASLVVRHPRPHGHFHQRSSPLWTAVSRLVWSGATSGKTW